MKHQAWSSSPEQDEIQLFLSRSKCWPNRKKIKKTFFALLCYCENTNKHNHSQAKHASSSETPCHFLYFFPTSFWDFHEQQLLPVSATIKRKLTGLQSCRSHMFQHFQQESQHVESSSHCWHWPQGHVAKVSAVIFFLFFLEWEMKAFLNCLCLLPTRVHTSQTNEGHNTTQHNTLASFWKTCQFETFSFVLGLPIRANSLKAFFFISTLWKLS